MKRFIAILLSTVCWTGAAADDYEVTSPSGRMVMSVTVGERVEYSVAHDGVAVLEPSQISMTLGDGTILGRDAVVERAEAINHAGEIASPLYKKSTVRDNFYELRLMFRGDWALVLRAYEDGVAYRFEISRRDGFTVAGEQAEFRFPDDARAWFPYAHVAEPESLERQFRNSFEQPYKYTRLSEFDARRLAFLPVLVEGAGGRKVCITEADLLDYPGMFIYNGDGDEALEGMFAPYPKTTVQGGHNMLQGIVTGREEYIARFDGEAVLPWRVVIVARDDAALLDSDMVYRLASPSRVDDASWVEPGKVAWEWWHDWNLHGVDFRAGIDNRTYEYYIDFAATNGIEYVILDEGWAVNMRADLRQVVPELDLPALVDYATERGVGIILWAGYMAFDRDMEEVCRHYSEMGVRGFKIDFMDRDDQYMVDFHRRAAEVAAKYRLVVDFHGTYKPTGLNRTYPNVVNFEGVWGLEQMKWDSDFDQVEYDVTVPFIRMVAGPMDYTQGAMRNATRGNYRAVYSEPMSQGTRCRQLAEYVVFEAPVGMLCDSPTSYMREEECLRFIAAVPTVWDRTHALGGEVGRWVGIARERDDVWYVGAMTDWEAREVELDMSFLGEGVWMAEIFEDGINADRAVQDYTRRLVAVPANRRMTVRMAPGGGVAMKISRD